MPDFRIAIDLSLWQIVVLFLVWAFVEPFVRAFATVIVRRLWRNDV